MKQTIIPLTAALLLLGTNALSVKTHVQSEASTEGVVFPVLTISHGDCGLGGDPTDCPVFPSETCDFDYVAQCGVTSAVDPKEYDGYIRSFCERYATSLWQGEWENDNSDEPSIVPDYLIYGFSIADAGTNLNTMRLGLGAKWKFCELDPTLEVEAVGSLATPSTTAACPEDTFMIAFDANGGGGQNNN